MIAGRVIGSIWATKKDARLAGNKLLVIQPIDYGDPEKAYPTMIAADLIGAGVGEEVIVVTGSSARAAMGNAQSPIDATVVGIIDSEEIRR